MQPHAWYYEVPTGTVLAHRPQSDTLTALRAPP